MGNFIKYIQLVLGIVPAVIEMIKAVEISGNGAEKAATVIGIVRAALELLPLDLQRAIGVDKVEMFLQKTIDLVVNLLNKAGFFKSSGKGDGEVPV